MDNLYKKLNKIIFVPTQQTSLKIIFKNIIIKVDKINFGPTQRTILMIFLKNLPKFRQFECE